MRAALVALVVLAPFAASLAEAQLPLVDATLTVAVEDPGHALQPGKNETLLVILNYAVGTGGVPAPGPDPTNEQNDTQRTRITLSTKTLPSWVENVTFDPPVVEVKPPTGSGRVPALANAILFIKPDAPALKREDIIIVGTSSANGNIKGSSGESPPIKLRAAFIAKVNVTAPVGVVVPGGQWTDVPFTLRNTGNNDTRVRLNVTARPLNSQVEFPGSVTIKVGESATVNVRLRVPWTYGEGGIIELEATPLTNDDEGKPAKADVEVHGQSAVPGVGIAGLLALVAGFALLARRR